MADKRRAHNAPAVHALLYVVLIGATLCAAPAPLQAGQSAAAQAPAQQQTPAQAGSELTCPSQDHAGLRSAAPAPHWPKQGPAQNLDQHCWASAAQIAAGLHGANGYTLVDVRPRSSRQLAPLANALELELADIGSKRFLQHEPLVLIGTGLDYARLNQACQQLRQQGFTKVQALRAGAAAWQAAQAGVAHAGPQIQAIDAQDWIASLGQGIHWTVVSSSEALRQAPAQHQPVAAQHMVFVRAQEDRQGSHLAAAVLHAYRDAAGQAQKARSAQALIVIADATPGQPGGMQRLQLEQALAQALAQTAAAPPPSTAVPLYWLQGGWHGYTQQVAQTAAIQQTASHRLQAPCGRM